MKTFKLISILLLFSFIASSQKKIEVITSSQSMSKGDQMAFSVLVPEAKAADLEPLWKKYINNRSVGQRVTNLTTQIGNIFKSAEKDAERDKLKVQKNGDELYVRALNESLLTEHPLDVYARLTEQEDGCTLSAFFQYTDSAFINENNANKNWMQGISSYIRDFGVVAYQKVVEDQIDEAKKEVTRQENILKDITTNSRKEEKSIVRNETIIDELNAEIETIESDISRLNEIMSEKKLVMEKQDKKSADYDVLKKELKELSKDKKKYYNKIKSTKTKIKSKDLDIAASKNKIEHNNAQAAQQEEIIIEKQKIVDQLIDKKAAIN